ncbi:MAG: hypothetical protein O3B13_02315 [Planctomycetota bacterium]|nr:hypothetical protein [Planctomycetota bacterium]
MSTPRLHVMRRSGQCLVAIAMLSGVAAAQTVQATRGFDIIAKPVATGEERQSQSNLWIFELHVKTLRMIEVEVTDPRTGTKRPELVYYLVYRAINREIDRKTDNEDIRPVNDLGDNPVPDLFVSEITLVTSDNGTRTVVKDSVIPEAQIAIGRRERLRLLNSVEAAQPIPAPVPDNAEDPESFYGVAIFRSVPADTDYFSLFLSGFSNGYKLVKGPVDYDDLKQLAADGELHVSDQVWNGDLSVEWRASAQVGDLHRPNKFPPDGASSQQWYYTVTNDRVDESVTVWRKTLVQDYWRPGDAFDQNEREIRTKGLPRWIYRPDDLKTAPPSAVQTALQLP